ncbi:hypothetical protein CYY_004765 [Polysphondylium violaceum]|uniref:EGF-like domain-containing protein n=1 Tax=Polysphondylium violaceum TaxID=133409 RepID=A0A8J4PUW8_9MYCE|nr:hypothetical protein CYY_004765 [Polysphondylium violaceum]
MTKTLIGLLLLIIWSVVLVECTINPPKGIDGRPKKNHHNNDGVPGGLNQGTFPNVGVLQYYYLYYVSTQCFASPCPQFYVKASNTIERRLPIINAYFPDGVNTTEFLFQKDNYIVLFGMVVPHEQYSGNYNIQIFRAYKGMPLTNSISPHLDLFAIGDNGVRGVKAPCPNIYVGLVNTNANFTMIGVTEPYTSTVTRFDKAWYNGRFYSPNALLVQGSFDDSGVFNIAHSFVLLPDPLYGCPLISNPLCEGNSVNVYIRDSNRCLHSDGCTTPGFCSLIVPSCSPGYRLVSYPARPNGCPSFVCECNFLSQIS